MIEVLNENMVIIIFSGVESFSMSETLLEIMAENQVEKWKNIDLIFSLDWKVFQGFK